VEYRMNTRVTALGSSFRAGRHRVTSIEHESDGKLGQTPVVAADRVMVTLGSTTHLARRTGAAA
jgi:hypothetical protein